MSTSTHESSNQVVDWTDLGREMWSFLTGRRAAINYQFVDMSVEIPRDTGPSAPRAVWKFDGTLRVSTDDSTTRESS
ncbi:hypothetical protein [Nocardioides coralli]|uniref:hypothetical protein n=1 Tax=Nocardioides coralli TaxID=2872154 RepID=UPI001CA45C33|nr:hypothetical protein [Nocardioides coralli]QZY30558.1 hypothetical protein K6T13_07905 [Nocardioides coralli]